jgi:hypothetical protein
MRTVFSALAITIAFVQSALAVSLYSEKRADSLHPAHLSRDAYQSVEKAKRKYVKWLPDFKDHTASHIERIERMAVDFVQTHPTVFPGVEIDLLREYARGHDWEKSLDEFSPILYKAYGEQVKTNSGEVIKGFEDYFEAIEKMNAVGEEHERQFFLKYHNITRRRFFEADGKTYTDLAKNYQTVIHGVDLVDRSQSEVSPEEFGKKMIPVSEYAKTRPGYVSDRELIVAKYFEAPVTQAERVEYLRKLIAPKRSLGQLLSMYKIVTRYDVVNQGSRFREYQFRKRREEAFNCIMNSVIHNTRVPYLH